MLEYDLLEAHHQKTEERVRWAGTQLPKHIAYAHLPRVTRALRIWAAHLKRRIMGKGPVYKDLGSKLNTTLDLGARFDLF